MSGSPSRRLWYGAGAIAGGFAARSAPEPLLRAVPACPLHSLTGLHCPLCGSARALVHMAHGEWGGAWLSNPLVFTAAAIAAMVLLVRAAWRGSPPAVSAPARRALAIFAVAVTAAFAVMRNLHAQGFGWLGP